MTQLPLIVRERPCKIGYLVDNQIAQRTHQRKADRERNYDRKTTVDAYALQPLDQGSQQKRHQDGQRQRDENVLRDLQDGNDHDHRQQDDAGSGCLT